MEYDARPASRRHAPVQETVLVLRRVATCARRRPGAQILVWMVSVGALFVLFRLWMAATDALANPAELNGVAADELLRGVLVFVGSTLVATTMWAVLSTLQRAVGVAIALDHEIARASPVAAAWRDAATLVRLGILLAMVDALVGVVASIGALLVPSATLVEAMQTVLALSFLLWSATRSVTGVAVARVVVDRASAWRALRESTRALSGHRVAALTSRMLLLPLAGATIWVSSIPGWASWSWMPPIVPVASLVVIADAWIEAAWYSYVCAHVDAPDVAAVFD